jgi:acetyltransferase-like isoleucine patch superfamily enzyme
MRGSRIGSECQICDRVFVENGAVIGDRVTIKCGVSVWDGVTIEQGAFIGPGVQFTNDVNPRSRRHAGAYPSLLVGKYASIGAGAVLLPGRRIGEYAMVGAGAIVTKDVRPFECVVGNPARHAGWVCVCGSRWNESAGCESLCGRVLELTDGGPQLKSGSSDPVEQAQ